MAYPDWRSRDSEDAKAAVIGKAWWQTEVNDYLWYELGDIGHLTAFEKAAIIDQCFVPHTDGHGFGDVEMHRSQNLPGKPWLLRLRGRLLLTPALVLRDRYCPLYQIGRDSGPLPEHNQHVINFWVLWERDKGTKSSASGPPVSKPISDFDDDPEVGGTEPDLSRLTKKKS